MGLNKESRVAVSMVSLLPWSFGSGNINRSLEKANSSGFDWIQALPLRGICSNPLVAQRPVISREDAWNSGTVAGALKRYFIQPDNEDLPTFLDWFLFGNRDNAFDNNWLLGCMLPDAVSIKHELPVKKGELFEINPEGTDNFRCVGTKEGVVIDTKHVRTSRNGYRFDWKKVLSMVELGRVKMIHVQPLLSEYQAFLSGSECEMNDLCIFLAKELRGMKVDIVLEVKPTPNVFNTVGYLNKFRVRISEIFGV